MDPAHILIVEDDPRLGALMSEYLGTNGFTVGLEPRGDTAVGRILAEAPDLLILDLMLPGIDGFEVFRRVRPSYRGRTLFLTARRSDIDHVAGLELGADDFVTKPVDPRVLLARVQALLRRRGVDPVSDRVEAGTIRADRATRVASVADVELTLTTAEFELLWLLAQRAGQVVPRETLFQAVRGTEYDGLDRGIDIHVSRLRKKLKDAGLDGDAIKAVRSVGYQLAVRR